MSGDIPYRILAHAKLNLTLHVLAREVTGYHQIETLFCGLELADEIEIVRTASGVELEVALPPEESGAAPDLGPLEQNLAFRAASMFATAATLGSGVHIRLVKRIPAGAGLGGGSSDAAAVLRALNEISEGSLSDDELFALGVRLGSDVPFFLADIPLALAWGRGERMMALPPLPAAAVVLAVPPERVSTAEAYAALAEERSIASKLLRVPTTWNDIAAEAANEFETIIFERHPRLAELRTALDDAGALMARMTGTGSAVFAVFGDVAAADEAARRVEEAHPDVAAIVTRTRLLS